MMLRKGTVVALTAVLWTAVVLSGQAQATKPQAATPSREARVENYIFWLPDASLVYEPGSRSLEIKAMGTVLSRGEGWERRQVKPYLYHLRLASWKCYFWLVNTSRREVYVVFDGVFGGIGKAALARAPRETEGAREDMTVDVVGGGQDRTPERFTIRLATAQLFFVPATGDVRLAAAGSTLSPSIEWESLRLHDDLYHVRLKTWKNFFWKVRTSRMEAWRIRGAAAVFGKPGGEETPLPVTMVKSSIPLSLALLRATLKAAERSKLEEIARMIISGRPASQIKKLSAEFIRQYPDVDPESAVMEVTKEIERDPDISREIKELEKKMDELRDKRQEFETAFENFDQKSNQLFNVLSTVLKTMKETQSALARNMTS
jgi:hypothetical protein